MVNLPGPYFFGSVALLGLLAVLLVRWTWFEKIHGIARWWVSTYLSLFALSLAAFALSVIGHFAFRSIALSALFEDPSGAVAYFTETGMEAMFFGIALVPLTIILLEIRRFQRVRAIPATLDAVSKRKRLLYGMALLVGPLFFFSGFVSRVEEMFFFFVVPWSFSIPALAVAWGLNWCIENPNARLHQHLGMQRLAAASAIHGVLWLPVLWTEFGSRLREPVDVVLAASQSLLVASIISFVTWGAVNIIGWVVDGFLKRS